MTFHIGMKVVCVDDSEGRFTKTRLLKRGDIYTIRGFDLESEDGLGVHLEEIYLPEDHTRAWINPESSWRAERFRPLIERSTEAGVEILRQIARDVTERKPVKVGA